MYNDIWSWAINHHKGQGYWVSLHKESPSAYWKQWLGGHLIRYGWTYKLGNKWIIKNSGPDVATLPISEELAIELGWNDWGS